eukprot:5465892-Heterocapsa_arctica.AAC.1
MNEGATETLLAIPTHDATDGAASGNGQRQWSVPWPAVSAGSRSAVEAPARAFSAATVGPPCGRRVHGSLARTATAG